LRTIPTGAVGRGIAVGGGAVWVSDDAAGTVSRIDPHTNHVTDRIGVGNGATALAFGADALWVTNGLDGTVSRIDPATNVPIAVGVGGSPEAIAVADDGVWVSDETAGRLVRPADIRYAVERDFALKSPGVGLYEGIRGAAGCAREPTRCDLGRGVVTDARANTVTFHLVAPDPEFPVKLALPFAAAVPVG